MNNLTDFKAAWWLANPHLQTLWPTLTRRHIKLETTRSRLELLDGDFIDLVHAGEGDGPIVVIMHGLGGSESSHYARGLMKSIINMGWRAVLMQFRGCSGEPNRLHRSYHSGDTADFGYLIIELKKQYPNTDLYAVGYSLGGNVLLKWLGESEHNNQLKAAVAVSVPFELHKAANHLLTGFSRVYQWHLLRNLRRSLKTKYHHIPAPFDINKLPELKNFWRFDDTITAPINGFADVHDYYAKSSSKQFLPKIKTPTLVIHAKDDPFMGMAVLPNKSDLSDAVTFELYDRGGHVGFISGEIPGRAEYWLETRIPAFFQEKNN